MEERRSWRDYGVWIGIAAVVAVSEEHYSH
jgi:hypothetical protein